MSDLSEGAIDEAELEGCEVSFFRVRAVDRWLSIEAPDCAEIDRSRGRDMYNVVPVVSSILCNRVVEPRYPHDILRVVLGMCPSPCDITSTSYSVMTLFIYVCIYVYVLYENVYFCLFGRVSMWVV